MDWISTTLVVALYLVVLACLWPDDDRRPWVERGKYWRRR
jgi:hypothetical protein